MDTHREFVVLESSTYTSLPLNQALREIRVLVVWPGEENDVLTCTMEKRSLEDESATDFIALSYCPTDGPVAPYTASLEAIYINGVYGSVSPSLAGALRSIRKIKRFPTAFAPELEVNLPPHVWIDAVCINQHDMVERTVQYPMVDDIYASAKSVVVWLGDGDEHTNTAFDFMCTSAHEAHLADLIRSRRQPTRGEIVMHTVLEHDICRRSWWGRVWQLREFSVAKEVILFCGDRTVSWDRFNWWVFSVPRPNDYPESASTWNDVRQSILSSSLDTISSQQSYMDMLRNNLEIRKACLPVCRALRNLYPRTAASDPKDFVREILRGIDEQEFQQLLVDSASSPMELYQQVGRTLWEPHPTTKVSELLPDLIFYGDESAYPSWAPDFGQQKHRGWRDNQVLVAGKAWMPWMDVTLKRNAPRLRLTGIKFDTIKRVYLTPERFANDSEMIMDLRAKAYLTMDASTTNIPEGHRLYALSTARRKETLLETFTKSPLIKDPLCPGLSDDELWEVLMNRQQVPAELSHLLTNEESMPLYSGLRKALSKKYCGRSILVTESGFVGLGDQHIKHEDCVAWVHGTRGPLILRSFSWKYRIVGFAYVSGLMDIDLLDQWYRMGFLPDRRVFEVQ